MRIKDECSIIVPRKDIGNNVTTTDGKGMKGNNVNTGLHNSQLSKLHHQHKLITVS